MGTGHGVEWPARAGAAAWWGWPRRCVAEQPERRCRIVDLDPTLPITAQQEALALECAAADEPAVAWRHGRRYARRLQRMTPPRGETSSRAVLRAPGVPPTIDWQPLEPISVVPAGHVLIEVVAAGLNFRDRLVALGLRPAETPLGADLAGIVRRIGDGVAGLQAGDAARGPGRAGPRRPRIGPGRARSAGTDGRSGRGRQHAGRLCHRPGRPGQLRPADSVLVHQAAGATGLAALEIARTAGAAVCATASAGKRAFLAASGIERIADSREPASWQALGPVDVAFGAFGPTLAADLPAARVVDLTGEGVAGFNLDALPVAARGACLDRLATFPPPARAVARDALADAIACVGEAIGRTVVVLREPPRVRIEQQAAYSSPALPARSASRSPAGSPAKVRRKC